MAAVSESRVNFNPEWMGSTYSATSKFGQSGGTMGTSPAFGGSNTGGGNAAYCGGGSAANNADSNILAPPKLAKNRYGREEMLALFTGNATVAPPELKPTFPEFFVEQHQDPICMLSYTDIEERLLLQGGINSSKVINVVNHAERNMRWQGPPRSFGRGISPTSDAAPAIPGDVGTQQQPGPPFVGSRPPSMLGMGRGMPRGPPYQSQPGFDQMNRPPGRFGMMAKGRGDGGRGRGFDRYSTGFGGPPFMQNAVRFADNSGGAPQQDEEEWAPQNPRAQGLYDPNDPRDRPRQRQKSTSRADEDDPNAPSYGQPNQNRNSGGGQRRGYSGSIDQAVPEWALDDEESMDDTVVGTFDSSGQFQAASDTLDSSGKDITKKGMTSKKIDNEQKPEEKDINSITAVTAAPLTVTSAIPDKQKASVVASTKEQPPNRSISADASPKLVGRSIPVESLFSNQPSNLAQATAVDISAAHPKPFPETVNAAGNNQARRLPKTFATLGQQDQAKLNVNGPNVAHSAGASPDASLANLNIAKLLAQSNQNAPFPVPQRAEPAVQRQKENAHVQPKFVVPKAISSSSDEVFTHLHEDVESLVNSFSADDMPATIRNRKEESVIESSRQFQQQPYSTVSQDTMLNFQQSTASVVRTTTTSSAPPRYDRTDSVNAGRNIQFWYYTDPQGGERGPFETTQMAAWFTAGYFTMQLMVRRAEDKEFVPLGDLIKQFGRIPFVPSTCSSAADTPSPNPMSTASVITAPSTDYSSSSVIHPAARYGVASPATAARTTPSTIFGALTNHTGGGAFQKTAPIQQATAVSSSVNRPASGAWDVDFTSSTTGNKSKLDVNGDDQARILALNQMLQMQREKEEKIKRAKEEEQESQRKLAEAEAARREEEERRKRKEDELRRLQEAKAEEERRRKEEEERRLEEAKRLEEKRLLEEQQRRLEELAKKDAEERKKRAAAEEQLRKEREALEAADRKRRKEEEKAVAAAALKQQQEEERKKQQQLKKSTAPWASQQQQAQRAQASINASANKQSLMEIQLEEERQMLAEKRQEAELEAQRRQNAPANTHSSAAWGGTGATTKLTWEQSSNKQRQMDKTFPALIEKAGNQRSGGGGGGLWDDDDIPPVTAPKTAKSQKPSQTVKNAGKALASSPVNPQLSAKKEQNVKKLFQGQQPPSDEFTNWCVKQVNLLNPDIDAHTLVSFLKEVDAPAEVEDYVVGYFGDSRSSREFTKSFLARRAALRKHASSKATTDDLSTPAPALNPVKAAIAENVVPNAADKTAGGAGAGKKKKSGKSAGRFVVDGSILGFKAAADPNRLNAGEIDSPM